MAGRILNKLMNRLGFSRYLVQGGDWGSEIATSIAFYYPEKLVFPLREEKETEKPVKVKLNHLYHIIF